MADLFYTSDKECPVCQKKFSVTRVRNRLVKLRQDSDFCTYYEDVNPNYYSIWACPNCGYTAQDTYFCELPGTAAEKIRNFLKSREVHVDFSGSRNREQAIATYKLAIFFADMAMLKASQIASLYMKLGWLYREAEDKEMEVMALGKALEYYEKASMKERFPIGNLNEVTFDYLLAELLRRVGRMDEALRAFNKVVSNPQAKNEKMILDMAREAWHEVRALRDAEAVEAQ